MFKTLINTLLLSSTILLSSAASALPIQQADAFVAGDNKAALETSTGLVWLDFGITNNQTVTSVLEQLDSTYAGWRLPTQTEVINLWSSLFGHLPGWFSAGTFGYVSGPDLGDDFSAIYDIFNVNGVGEYTLTEDDITTSWPIVGAQGLFMLDNGAIGAAMMYSPISGSMPGYTAFFYENIGPAPLEWKHEFTSTFLVKKQSVPEPSSLLLFFCGFLLIAAIRVKQNQRFQ